MLPNNSDLHEMLLDFLNGILGEDVEFEGLAVLDSWIIAYSNEHFSGEVSTVGELLELYNQAIKGNGEINSDLAKKVIAFVGMLESNDSAKEIMEIEGTAIEFRKMMNGES